MSLRFSSRYAVRQLAGLCAVFIVFLMAGGTQAQTQVGSDIRGAGSESFSGFSVALSSDGSRLAIGSVGNSSNGDRAGLVRVYEYDGSEWTPLGLAIEGEAAGDEAGWSVALSWDGNTVAVGAPGYDGTAVDAGYVRTFRYDGTQWLRLGSEINGEAEGDRFGTSVSLSSDGNQLAAGAPGNDGTGPDAGHVRVFQLDSSEWVPFGSAIDGEAGGDRSGEAISLSSGGLSLAVGAPFSDGNGDTSGHVRVYEYDGSAWVQLGFDMDGEEPTNQFGSSVALSADGSRVAAGAPFHGPDGDQSGQVRVYEFTSIGWLQLGADLDGVARGDMSGSAVSLSADGIRLAVGAPGHASNGARSGHLQVYDFDGDEWIQVGADIDSRSRGDRFGASISLAADGSQLVAGGPGNSDAGLFAGHTRVFEIDASPVNRARSEVPASPAVVLSPVYPNPFTDRASFSVTLPAPESVSVAVFDALGRQVMQLHSGMLPVNAAHTFRVERGGLPSGVYVLRVAGRTFAESRRIVVR